MIESGQQFGLYVVKNVFESSKTQACCCAEDPFFNREVILKTFATELFSDEDRLAVLENLLERLALLDHPSIAPIYDSGLEEGTFYYTTVGFSGATLAERLNKAFAADEALKILFELTEAFDYAFQQELGQEQVLAEKIYFDDNGRAILFDFGIDNAVEQIIATGAVKGYSENVESTLQGLGELLLRMLLGAKYDGSKQVEELCDMVDNSRVRRLLGRLLLPGDWHFESYSELLEELCCFDEVEDQVTAAAAPTQVAEVKPAVAADLQLAQAETEKMVADVRRLVAEKNGLQQALDKALYHRNQADNKLSEGQRKLAAVQQEVAKVKEEANVAWELVAGQKNDRWRPAAWAVGGFLLGFIISGSYGYYYSEQTRNELLAKLKANEELIKTAAWRTADQQPPEQGVVTEADQEQEAEKIAQIKVKPVAEEPREWWPAGSEFSSAAAIPMAQIKAALGFKAKAQEVEAVGLSEVLRREVVDTVNRWANAWSDQDLQGYFSVYSETYRPALGQSQDEWRKLRRTRVSKPQWIELDLQDIRVRQVSEDLIQVKLKQHYRSDFYQDQVLKSLNLIKEDGEWRIQMERSLGMVWGPHYGQPEEIVGG